MPMHDDEKVFIIYDVTSRVDTSDVSEVKIECDDYGYYVPVAILKTGETIHIEL